MITSVVELGVVFSILLSFPSLAVIAHCDRDSRLTWPPDVSFVSNLPSVHLSTVTDPKIPELIYASIFPYQSPFSCEGASKTLKKPPAFYPVYSYQSRECLPQ